MCQEGDEVTVEAEPLEGFEFKALQVEDKAVITEKSYVFPVEKDKRLHFTANIALNDAEEAANWSINPDGTDLRQE